MPVRDQLASLRSWLEHDQRWLLIFDNVEQPSHVEGLMPQVGGGHVLVTSRHSGWGSLAQVLKLDVWSPDESAQYLMTRTGQSDGEAAADLAKTLGYLPLAIEQAAAYVDESQITLAQYSGLFQKSRAKLLSAAHGKATVGTIWSLSLRAVEAESANAVTLLQLLAFLPPDGFPRDRLRRPGIQVPRVAAAILESDLSLNDAIVVLRRYSLLEATPETVSVHRLVQAVVQDSLSDNQHRAFSQAAHHLQHGTGEPASDEPEPDPDGKLKRTWRVLIWPWRYLPQRYAVALALALVTVAAIAGFLTYLWLRVPRPSSVEQGAKLYVDLTCDTCHEGNSWRGPVLNSVFGSQRQLQDGSTVTADEAYLREAILNPQARITEGYQPIMPTYQGLVTEVQVSQLIDYMKSLPPPVPQTAPRVIGLRTIRVTRSHFPIEVVVAAKNLPSCRAVVGAVRITH